MAIALRTLDSDGHARSNPRAMRHLRYPGFLDDAEGGR